MSGKFEKGRWVEVSVDIHDTESNYDRRLEVISDLKRVIENQIEDYKKQMFEMGVRARKAGFWDRLKYLFTRKI